ncbi:hypothetical protein [Streptomyces sp. KL116D]|uniref:hypothetical protein n=1 Tax=Streptomyces sp. KL116D TaxID=3045152 RepID=UPI00355896D9
MLSSGAFALVGTLPDDAFYSWGWRLPFLIAFPLLGFAPLPAHAHRGVPGLPQDAGRRRTQQGPKPAPLVEAFRRTWGRMIVAWAPRSSAWAASS